MILRDYGLLPPPAAGAAMPGSVITMLTFGAEPERLAADGALPRFNELGPPCVGG
ncbi:hypothetical protein ACFU76_03810 [Streptomyces sp. NPDC057539]|uniref:hypothetical protein n=1 Tax=Streptomyces sp. NPDC057539 TaxID=3346159 RepID=UPI0036A1229F